MPRRNALLASMPPGAMETLGPHLKGTDLKAKEVLFRAGETISAVYFPASAVVSLVVGLSTGEMVEAAMVGRDGVVGASSALDGRMSLNEAIVQLGGDAFVCEPEVLKQAALQSHALLSLLVRHEQAVYAQAQQSTACMAAHDVQARLCRWLLRARDLSDGADTLDFTQEFLAEMLGVRRTSVTTVALTLQHAGMIKYSRGHIRILNVEALQDAACECYEAVKTHYHRLIGAP